MRFAVSCYIKFVNTEFSKYFFNGLYHGSTLCEFMTSKLFLMKFKMQLGTPAVNLDVCGRDWRNRRVFSANPTSILSLIMLSLGTPGDRQLSSPHTGIV